MTTPTSDDDDDGRERRGRLDSYLKAFHWPNVTKCNSKSWILSDHFHGVLNDW